MEGILWALITIVGPIMLSIGLAYAVIRNKFEQDQAPREISERGARRLRDQLDREDRARETGQASS